MGSLFGFLRARELTVPGNDVFDAASHLTREDFAVDIPEDPTVVRVRLKASKTDPFRRGITLIIGNGDPDLCPVKALVCYLLVRGEKADPFLVFEDRQFLTWLRFVKEVREALGKVGVNCTKYCGHSFRIGAATTAASRGMEDSLIMTLGKWWSLVM